MFIQKVQFAIAVGAVVGVTVGVVVGAATGMTISLIIITDYLLKR